jgi:hypothetical protein
MTVSVPLVPLGGEPVVRFIPSSLASVRFCRGATKKALSATAWFSRLPPRSS